MNTLADHPRVCAYRKVFAEGVDPAAVDAFVDELQEDLNATAADLLLLYRGRPSLDPLTHCLASTFNEDEGLRLTLARWVQAREPWKAAPVHPRDRGRDCTLTLLHDEVRLCELDLEEEAERLARAYNRTSSLPALQTVAAAYRDWLTEMVQGTSQFADDFVDVSQAAARARRAQKRRVLALFTEVQFKLERVFSEEVLFYRGSGDNRDEWVKQTLTLAGFRTDAVPWWTNAIPEYDRDNRRYVYTQTLPAPGLIAPDSSPGP